MKGVVSGASRRLEALEGAEGGGAAAGVTMSLLLVRSSLVDPRVVMEEPVPEM